MRLCFLGVRVIVLYRPFRPESGRVWDIFSSFPIDFLDRHDMNRVIIAGEPVSLVSDAKAWKCSESAKRLRTKPLAKIIPIPSLNRLTSPRLHLLRRVLYSIAVYDWSYVHGEQKKTLRVSLVCHLEGRHLYSHCSDHPR
jgi:hypothetical protein